MQVPLTLCVTSPAFESDLSVHTEDARRLREMLANVEGVQSAELLDGKALGQIGLGLLFGHKVGQIILEIPEPRRPVLGAVASAVALWIKGKPAKIVKLSQTDLELRGDFGQEEAEAWATRFPSLICEQNAVKAQP